MQSQFPMQPGILKQRSITKQLQFDFTGKMIVGELSLDGRVRSIQGTLPIALGVDLPVYVSFYGTGIRNRSSLANVAMTINGISVPILYAGPAPGFTGLDQVNAGLVLSLRGSGESKVVLTVDGQAANTVTINVQ